MPKVTPMGKTGWAEVVDEGRLGPWEVRIGNRTVYRNNERPESCHRLARYINDGIEEHSEIVRLREVEKAAVDVIQHHRGRCGHAYSRGEESDEMAACYNEKMGKLRDAYEKSKAQDKGD